MIYNFTNRFVKCSIDVFVIFCKQNFRPDPEKVKELLKGDDKKRPLSNNGRRDSLEVEDAYKKDKEYTEKCVARRSVLSHELSKFVTEYDLKRTLNVGESLGQDAIAKTHLRCANIELPEASEMLVISRRAFRDVVEADDRQRVLDRDNFLHTYIPVDMTDLSPIIHHRVANLFRQTSVPFRHTFCTAGTLQKPTTCSYKLVFTFSFLLFVLTNVGKYIHANPKERELVWIVNGQCELRRCEDKS